MRIRSKKLFSLIMTALLLAAAMMPFGTKEAHAADSDVLQERIERVEINAIRPLEGSTGTTAFSSDPADWAEIATLPSGQHCKFFTVSWLGPDGIMAGPDIKFTKGICYTMQISLIGETEAWYFSDKMQAKDIKINNGKLRSFEFSYDRGTLDLEIDVEVLEPEKLEQTLTVTSKYTKKYGDKPFYLNVKSNGNGMPVYKASDKKIISINESGRVTIKGTGKVTITVYAPETEAYKKSASKTITLNIRAAKNTMTVKTKAVKVKYSKLKKKKQTISTKKAFTVKKAKGSVTYKKYSGNKKITISKGGIIAVKKGLKPGKYTLGVKVTATGNSKYAKLTRKVHVTIVVK